MSSVPISKKQQPILVVDDSAAGRKIVELQLEKFGCAVDAAASGHEAIGLTLRRQYALIVMDVQMPDLCGLSVTQRIRGDQSNLCREIPIIGLTAYATMEERLRCLEAGMTDCYAKPITPQLLEELINKWTH